jgi:alkylated DNA nucleotide flippase Atl1
LGENTSSKKKTWREKLNQSGGLPRVETMNEKMSKRWGTGTIVIPAPMEVDAIMKKIPTGKLTTINEIRSSLAKKHNATIGCPITTGIFAWIAANAAEENRQKGFKNITPFWRTLKTGGFLNEKYPGGVEAQKKLLEQEGHTVTRKGERYIVLDCEKVLAQID